MRLQIVLDIDEAADTAPDEILDALAEAFTTSRTLEVYGDDGYRHIGSVDHIEFTILPQPDRVL